MKAEIAGNLARILISLLGRSWRVKRLKPRTGLAGDSSLYAFWHGVQFPLIFVYRKMDIRLLISKSKDGSLVASFCRKMGFIPIRGSSSRGGATAAKQLIESLSLGHPGAITPDGPKGPPETVKRGLSLVAKRARVSIVPVGVRAFPSVNLKSWDSFLIPLPFSTVAVTEGKPIEPKNCNEETLTAAIKSEASRARLQACPFSVFQITVIKILAHLITPLVSLILFSRGKRERLERSGKINLVSNRPVWLHGSSLGEISGLMPVIKLLRKAGIPCFITCSTPSARAFIQEQNLKGAFLPLDVPLYVNRFLNNLNPSALILAETEFWPVLLHETVTRGITAGLINGRLSKQSARNYKMIRSLFRDIMGYFRLILTRTEKDSERFQTLGLKTIVAGDSKTLNRPKPPEEAWFRMIKPANSGILVAGSTRSGEEEMILEIAREAELTPIIVPRHTGRIPEIIQLAEKLGFTPELWTDKPVNSNCLIVDTKGVLSSLYGLASIAFVGGTLVPIGGHNIHEPLSHEVPVIVGPEHFHYSAVVKEAVENNICRVFTSVESAVVSIKELLTTHEKVDLTDSSQEFSKELKKMLKLMEINL